MKSDFDKELEKRVWYRLFLSTIIKENVEKILNEGGNVAALDRETGEPKAFAEKIDVNKIDRKNLVKEFKTLFLKLNEQFNSVFRHPLWEDFSVVSNNEAFSGSSKFLFDLSISDEDFSKYKPKVGDIDITVPFNYLDDLFEMLSKLEGRNITRNIKYIGTNKLQLGKKDQINTIFQYTIPDTEQRINVQIDFEAAEYEKNKPTNWAKFSHSSSWEDIKEGLKGVAHKYLLKNIVRAVSYRPDIVILTPKSPLYPKNKIRVKKITSIPKDLAFSVSKGLRNKIEQQFVNGQPVMVDGKFAFKEVPTEESKYITDIDSIFEMIFKTSPTKEELSKFDSFVGLLDLMERHLDNDVIQLAVDNLIEFDLWGPKAQNLDRNTWKEDFRVKKAIVNKLFDKLPFLKSSLEEKVEMLSNPCSDYYIKYRQKTGEQFDCSQKESFVNSLKTFITEYVDHFFNKSRGLVERKQGEVYIRTKKRLKRGGKKIAFEETYILPEEGGQAESFEDLQDMIKEKLDLSEYEEIHEGIVGSTGIELNAIVNKPTSRSKAAMIVVFTDSKGKKIAFLKYFHNISAGGYGKWRDVDFFKETGYSRESGSSRIEILPIKPSDLIGDERARSYQEILNAIETNAKKLVNKRMVPEFFLEHIAQIKDAIISGKPCPVLEGANPYRSVYAKYLGEILQPISVVSGWLLTGQYKEAEEQIVKDLFPSKSFSDMKISYPMSAINNLIDSELVLGNNDLVVGISSKSGIGGGASASVSAIYNALKDDKELTKKMSQQFPEAVSVIKGIKENNQIEGPLIVAVDIGLISKDEMNYVRNLFGETGTRGDMVSVDEFLQMLKNNNVPSMRLIKFSKLLGNTSIMDVMKTESYSKNYKPGFHLLAGVAKALSTFVNKNTNFGKAIRGILNKGSVVQIYTKTRKAGENGIVFDNFSLSFPPTFKGTIDLSSRKTYYTTGINGKMTFEMRRA